METEPNHLHVDVPGGVPLKMWTRGVPVEDEARRQLKNVARLPIVFKHVAAMPDVHFGIGATVGSVIATRKAIIPAAVGVDIGCGMMAVHTTLAAADLPDNLAPLRAAIERAVPHGRVPGPRDPGAWSKVPGAVDHAWAGLEPAFTALCKEHPSLARTNHRVHLGTLGSGNHFIEVCLDESGDVWFMLHSGSRGVGNPESFHSCSHGAGRAMSRGEARRRFTLEDHRAATAGVECRKDRDVIDETPGAYKDIDAVMQAQRDLVEVVHTLKQLVCVKG